MPDAVLIVLLVFILYFPVCLLIAFIRALFSKKHHRKENFKNTFWTFFISVDIVGNDIILRTQSGLVETVFPYGQPDGYVEFQNVRWDYSFVYLLGVTGNVGTFTGEKMFLKDFISRFTPFGFSVMDETYGHNITKFNGYLSSAREHHECIIEIYHEGDMVFVTEE